MFNPPLSPCAAQTQTKSKSSTQIESLVQRMVSAINSHDFSPTSPSWSCATYSFSAEVAFTSASRKLTLPEYLHLFETLVTTHPGYRGQRLRMVDVSSVVDEERGNGSVFTNMEWCGEDGDGLVKPTVGTYEFKRAGLQWVCVKIQVIPGISPSTGI